LDLAGENVGGDLEIASTSNAGCPMTDGKTALLTVNVWEHAYYIDYRNARPKYLEEIWEIVNWNFVAANSAPLFFRIMSGTDSFDRDPR
jgi:Fe-Mn family superoxide dismutase